MNNFHVFLLATALFFAACSSSTTTPSPPSFPGATTWNWVNSEGGFRGGVVTPKTAGYTQQFIFRTDSTFAFIRTPDTAKASWSGSYRIYRAFYAITRDTQYIIQLFAPPATGPTDPGGRLQYRGSDTILIGEDATDGIIETYARAK